MLFENYEHFHLLTTDGRMDSYSDYNAHLWVMQYCLNFKHYSIGTDKRFGEYILEQSVSIRAVPEIIVGVGGGGQFRGRRVGGQIFQQNFVPVLHTRVIRQC